MREPGTRIISWNTNRRSGQAPAQVRALLERTPDIVALQEVTPTTVPMLLKALRDGGLTQFRSTVGLSGAPNTPRPRTYGVLIASRYPLIDEPVGALRASWEEKALTAVFEAPVGALELHTVHVPPGSSHAWVKVEVLESVYQCLARTGARPRILCGDFNTPQWELSSGEVVTWAQRLDASGRVRPMRRKRKGSASRWDAAERNILTGLATFGFSDAFRSLHGYAVDTGSWVLRRRDREVRRRFDHLFASAELRVVQCRYLHEWRDAGLSDHAAIEADVAVAEGARSDGALNGVRDPTTLIAR
jgi:exonuclease III